MQMRKYVAMKKFFIFLKHKNNLPSAKFWRWCSMQWS